MKDPYAVLGIDKNATDEQVKEAYRELARKYHPDRYSDNPLSDLAKEKMQEINEAYDTIMNSRRGRKSSRSSGANYNNPSSKFADIRSYITSGRIEEAQELLDGIPMENRDAEWYFLNGTVAYRRGHFDSAYTSYATATRMDPSNPEYREAFARLQRSGGGFGGNPYGNPYQNPYQNPYGNPYQNPYGNFNAPQQPRATMFTALQKYADFSGRASRREFWLFVIFTQLVQFGIGFVCGLFLGYSDETLIIIGGLVMLFGLFTLIPNLAVGVRRCHDIGRSGWWLLIALVPCIGPIWLLILLALPSDVYNNQYGPNPNGAYPDEAWPAVVGILLLFISVLLNYAV